MREIALFYNFSDERLRKAKFALMPQKFSVIGVKKEDFCQPIGYLAGIKDICAKDEKYSGDGFSDEMIVMHNFTSQKIDVLIRALNKHGIGRVPLKAVVTPTNKNWDSIKLYEAVKADYEEMNQRKTEN